MANAIKRKMFGKQKKTPVAVYQDFRIGGMQMMDRLLWCKVKKCGKTYNQQRSIRKWIKCTMQRQNKGPKSSDVARMEIKVRGMKDWQEWCASSGHNNLHLMLILMCLIATFCNLRGRLSTYKVDCHILSTKLRGKSKNHWSIAFSS